MDVYIGAKRIRLDPSQAIGKGGEADIYRIGPATVLKLYKGPDHPDFAGDQAQMDAAALRIEEHQKKLPRFPKLTDPRVICPAQLATDRTENRILGYTMPFVDNADVLYQWSERAFRGTPLDNSRILPLFAQLHDILIALHAQNVVIGDFNDLNILIYDQRTPAPSIAIIDADSFQFDNFYCRLFTERFVDPLLCDPKASRPVLRKPHHRLSDWYAYSVMLFRSLLLCDPYGGVFKPAKKSREVLHAARPLHRITVFDREVKYPRPSLPFDRLPDELLSWFHDVFEQDRRDTFPLPLLKNMRWTLCADCKSEHGRPVCPVCKKAAPRPAAITQVVRGKVAVTRIFSTEGDILAAAWQGGELRYLYCEPDVAGGPLVYKRESGEVLRGQVYSRARYRLGGKSTLISMPGHLSFEICRPGQKTREQVDAEACRGVPQFDANEENIFYIMAGDLWREGPIGPERIGQVLENQTLFWVGPAFGFGYYRAGTMTVGFVFDAKAHALYDNVRLPAMKGHVVDSTCYFTEKLAWFMVSVREEGKALNRAVVLNDRGEVQATAEGEEGDGGWLSSIRGKFAAGNYLFGATHEGVVRMELSGKSIVKSAEFPDTEPFVDEESKLFPGKSGLHVVGRAEVLFLKMR